MTSTSFVFTELANTMKYGGGFLYNLVFDEWRHCVSQSEVWGRGCYITFFFTEWRHCVSQNIELGQSRYIILFVSYNHVICIRHRWEGEMGSSQHKSPHIEPEPLGEWLCGDEFCDQPISPYPTMLCIFSYQYLSETEKLSSEVQTTRRECEMGWSLYVSYTLACNW